MAWSFDVVADTGNWHHMDGWGWGMALSGWVFMVAIIGLVVWLIVSTTRSRGPLLGQIETPQQVLDRRYAGGDIDRDEYLERRRDLG